MSPEDPSSSTVLPTPQIRIQHESKTTRFGIHDNSRRVYVHLVSGGLREAVAVAEQVLG